MIIKRFVNGQECEFVLTSDEMELAYREQLHEYQREDAERHISEYCAAEDIDDCSSDEGLVSVCVERFGDESDCNAAENDTWQSIVETAVKEHVSKAKVSQ